MVTIETGTRTPLNVITTSKGINNRELKTMAGRVFTEDQAANWICHSLNAAIINGDIDSPRNGVE